MFDQLVTSTCKELQTSAASAADLIKTIASVIALPLAATTFLLGYRQREKERVQGYYHKVVIDVLFQEILDFFMSEVEAMTAAGRSALDGLRSNRKAMPRNCSIALSNFSEGLFALSNRIAERTQIFDEKLTHQIELDFEQIQDDVTGWFNDANLHKRRNLEDIAGLLRRGQRTIIKRLYQGDLRDF